MNRLIGSLFAYTVFVGTLVFVTGFQIFIVPDWILIPLIIGVGVFQVYAWYKALRGYYG